MYLYVLTLMMAYNEFFESLHLGCLHPVAWMRSRCRVSSMQRYYSSFYYLFTYLLHVSVLRSSSGRNYTTDNGSVVFRIVIVTGS
jgi:hypothetical protein